MRKDEFLRKLEYLLQDIPEADRDEAMDYYRDYEKTMVLRSIDRNWINHIDQMDKLRNGIHLRSYASENPLKAYVSEGYDMFETMMGNISRDVVNFCMALRIRVERK